MKQLFLLQVRIGIQVTGRSTKPVGLNWQGNLIKGNTSTVYTLSCGEGRQAKGSWVPPASVPQVMRIFPWAVESLWLGVLVPLPA